MEVGKAETLWGGPSVRATNQQIGSPRPEITLELALVRSQC